MTLLAAEKRAPEFSLPDLHGAETSIEHLLSRGPILLVFFKVTCPTCQFTLPFIDRIEKSGRLTIVGISQDDVSATNEFRAAFDVNFPMLIDDPGRRSRYSSRGRRGIRPSRPSTRRGGDSVGHDRRSSYNVIGANAIQSCCTGGSAA